MGNKNITSIIIAIASFTAWGFVSIYWKQLEHFNALEVLSFRGVFALLFTTLFIIFLKDGLAIKRALTDRKVLITMIGSSFMIALNWGLSIWAFNNDRITETSMGYYINPLLNVVAAAIIFKVRMNKVQIISIALVSTGVLYLLISIGTMPTLALMLATSFCLYGVIRKIAPIATFPGMFIEALFVAIPSIIFLTYRYMSGTATFVTADTTDIILIVMSGFVTTVPLAGFAYAAKNLPLSTLGVIQYISPTLSFCVGVFLYKETFTSAHLVAFAFIWVALLIYTVDGLRSYKKSKELS